MPEPKLIGTLSAHYAKGKKAFSFEYDKEWIRSEQQRLIDPDIQFFSGAQFPNQKENFGVFLDSMPDTWGRTLMKRRAVQQARKQGERTSCMILITCSRFIMRAGWEPCASKPNQMVLS